MNILVTGATGAIGPRVVYALYQEGHKIHAFSVDSPPAGMFSPDVKVIVGDVTDDAAVKSAMQGMDAVIHMAALLHIVNPSSELREKYKHVNVGGTAKVVEAAIMASVKRVVLFSTIAVYGQADGQVLDEQTPTKPVTFYAQTKLAAEKIVLNARGADGQPLGAVLRLGAVYGPRIKGNYERLMRALASHRFIPVGNGLNRRTLVYDKDVGCAAVLAASHSAAAGRIFNVTDGKFHALNEIIESICSALGRKSPRLSLPSGIIRSVAGAIERGYRLFGLRSPITPEMVDKYTEDIAVNGSLIQKELGFVPHYDLQAGWRETIGEMRQMGRDL
jgi:nucleoside-diphosphate-sugar epimerase